MTKPSFPAPTQILPAVCLLLTVGLLWAGLRPFNPFPKNQVTWLEGGGLQFGRRGIAYSVAPVSPGPRAVMPNAAVDSAAQEEENLRNTCILLLKIQPEVLNPENSGTILDLYTEASPQQIRLIQWRDALVIRRQYLDDQGHIKKSELDVAHAFRSEEPVTFKIIGGPNDTVAYREGKVAAFSNKLGLPCESFAGQLLLGEAPIEDNPWHGKIFEVEFSRLDPKGLPAKVSIAHPLAPEQNIASNVPQETFAHYRLLGGSGDKVHSSAPAGPDLFIPKIFVVLHKRLLIPPWRELSDKLDPQDIALNIVGFMPFGFLVFAYFRLQCGWRRAAWLTVLAGFSISTIIEVLQAYLPSRTSGILDIIDNTLGTYLGVLFFRWRPLRVLGSRLHLYDLPAAETPQK